MASDSTRFSHSSVQAQADLELLQLVLQEFDPYPWNPSEPEAETYFAAMEQEVLNSDWLTPDDLAEQASLLSARLDQIWATVEPVAALETAANQALSADLFQRFATQIPRMMLERIIQNAQAVISQNLSLADQLVQCVQEILPDWVEEDLQVLARPLAYAMRGSESDMLEAALRSVRYAAWTELSGVEQARLSLAIARYAIAQAPAVDAAD